MVAILPLTLGTRSNAGRQAMDVLPPNIECALKKLRQATHYMDAPMDQFPSDVQSLLQLLQAQTRMIEAFASQMWLPANQLSSDMSMLDIINESEDPPSYTFERPECTIQTTIDVANDNPPDWFSTPVSACSASPIRRGSPCYSRGHRPKLRAATHPPPKYQQQSTRIFELPACLPTPPPSPPSKLSYFTYSPSSSTSPSFPSSRRSKPSPLILPSEHNCPTCDSKPWNYTSRPTPYELDLHHETQAHKAIQSLTTSPTFPTRITPSSYCGTITLHSTTYRREHYCVHDRSDRQCLLAYSNSPTWESDFPGIPAPRPEHGELAMELLVYPDCMLVIMPFQVPERAALRWYTLDAIGVGHGDGDGYGMETARATSVEVMFLGKGCLKLRIRLSELLGWDKVVGRGVEDRVVEFVGVLVGKSWEDR